jgi:hypothetical protein
MKELLRQRGQRTFTKTTGFLIDPDMMGFIMIAGLMVNPESWIIIITTE